jgi:hypothetical protein
MLVAFFFSDQHTFFLASITALWISEFFFAKSAKFLATSICGLMLFGLRNNFFYNTVWPGYVVSCYLDCATNFFNNTVLAAFVVSCYLDSATTKIKTVLLVGILRIC